jgi:N-acetylmuramoyl-L-alanine amidase
MRAISFGLLLMSVLGVWGSSQPEAVTVVLDSGHGGDDTGGIGLNGLIEKDIVLQIAHLIAIEAVNSPDIKITLTRNEDRYLLPAERLALAQRADLFISLHLDFSYDPRVRGITALVPTQAGASARTLAEILRKYLILVTKAPDWGTKTAPLWLRRLSIPAVQLNLGFVTNPEEARKLAQLSYQTRLARAILEGAREFLQTTP